MHQSSYVYRIPLRASAVAVMNRCTILFLFLYLNWAFCCCVGASIDVWATNDEFVERWNGNAEDHHYRNLHELHHHDIADVRSKWAGAISPTAGMRLLVCILIVYLCIEDALKLKYWKCYITGQMFLLYYCTILYIYAHTILQLYLNIRIQCH